MKKDRYISMENAGCVSNKTYAVPKENKSYTLVSLTGLSREELDKELQKGIDSLQSDTCYSVEEVDALLAKEYGI